MTTNEQFRINSLKKLAEEAVSRASDARTIANGLGDAFCTFKGDEEGIRAARMKYHLAEACAIELERLAYDAQVRAFYAERAAK